MIEEGQRWARHLALYRQSGGVARGPDPARGGGQFWLVSAGTASVPGGALLPVNSCVFVAPGRRGDGDDGGSAGRRSAVHAVPEARARLI